MCRSETAPMTLSDLHGHSPIASLSRRKILLAYSCAAVDNISTNLERRAIPLR